MLGVGIGCYVLYYIIIYHYYYYVSLENDLLYDYYFFHFRPSVPWCRTNNYDIHAMLGQAPLLHCSVLSVTNRIYPGIL